MLLQVPEQRASVEAEIRAHTAVQHHNVLPLVCSEIQENKDGSSTAFLLFPYYRVCVCVCVCVRACVCVCACVRARACNVCTSVTGSR